MALHRPVNCPAAALNLRYPIWLMKPAAICFNGTLLKLRVLCAQKATGNSAQGGVNGFFQRGCAETKRKGARCHLGPEALNQFECEFRAILMVKTRSCREPIRQYSPIPGPHRSAKLFKVRKFCSQQCCPEPSDERAE